MDIQIVNLLNKLDALHKYKISYLKKKYNVSNDKY